MKVTRVITLLVVVALLLGACAPAATPTPQVITKVETQVVKETAVVKETQVVKETVVVEPTAAPKIEIEFWSLLTGNLAEALDKQVQDFNNSQDRIFVNNINQGGYSPIQEKMLAAVAAGGSELPHVSMLDYIFVPWYAQGGWLEPLDKWVTAAELADFIPGLLLDLKFEGQTYALPYNRSTQGLYYNKDLYRKAGLDPDKPPQTWEEYGEYACQIAQLGNGTYGGYAWFSRWFWPPFIYGWGGQVNDAECNVAWDSPEATAAFTFFQKLHQDECTVTPANLTGGFTQSNAEFVQGTVAMVPNSTALLSWIGDVVEFDWGFTMLPAGPAGRAVTHGAANLGIHANKPEAEKAAAWEFVQFITSPAATCEFHRNTGYMATRYSALELPECKAFHAANPYFLVSIQQLEFARGTSCIEFSVPEFQEVVQGSAIPDIMINNRDVATVLAESAAEVQVYVDEYRAAGTLIIR